MMVQENHRSDTDTKQATDKGDPTGILVLGMHRSGTSAMTRVLNLLGAELGEHLLGPGFSNEQGFWEHLDAYRIDDQLLTSLGMSWDDPRRLPENWTETTYYTQALQTISQILNRDFGKSRIWAVKDPRICRLVPLWRDALRQMNVRPIAVIALRHPDEIAGSLAIRDGLSRSQVYLLWARHLCEAELATRGMRRCVVRYDRLLADWRAEVTQATKATGLQWHISLEDAAPDIDMFLNPDSRHHHRRLPSDARQHGTDGAWIDKMFHAYYGIAETEDWSAAVEITDSFTQIASLWDGYLDEVREKHDAANVQLQALMAERSQSQSISDMLVSTRSTVLTAVTEAEKRLHIGVQAGCGATDHLVTSLAHSVQTAVREEGHATREQELAQLEILKGVMEQSRQQLEELSQAAKHQETYFAGLRAELRAELGDLQSQAKAMAAQEQAMLEMKRAHADEVNDMKRQIASLASSLEEAVAKLEGANVALLHARLPWYKRIRAESVRDSRRKNG